MSNKLTTTTCLCALVILLFLIACPFFAQNTAPPSTPQAAKKIEQYLERMDKIGYSGSVLVALNGKPVISRGYGFSDEGRKLRNSANTISDIGSITKQFTAAAILKLEM